MNASMDRSTLARAMDGWTSERIRTTYVSSIASTTTGRDASPPPPRVVVILVLDSIRFDSIRRTTE